MPMPEAYSSTVKQYNFAMACVNYLEPAGKMLE